MNIAIFTHNYPKNKSDRKDAGIFVHDFVSELRKEHKVYVFCPDYGNSQKFGNWSIYNPIHIINFFKNIFFGVKESLKFVKNNKIDYVLCAWAIPSGIYALFANMVYKIPYGVWFLGSDLNVYSRIPFLGTLISIISKYADNLFANSYSLTKIASMKYGKCLMLPASTKVNKTRVASSKLKLNNQKVNILFVGRLEKIKGIDILLESFKKLDQKYNLTVIGDGTLKNELDKKNENIIFLGYKGLEVISQYMKKSDFLIIPSRNESLPLVILEAANHKLPVLASDVGDCKYVLNRYKIGEVFNINNSDQIIKSISTFNYKLYKNSGRFDDIVVDYSLNNSVRIFLKAI